MLELLNPTWKQSEETYNCVRKLLEQTPDERLHWKPAPDAWSISDMTQHIGRANIIYAMVMEGKEPIRRPFMDQPSRSELLESLDSSEAFVRQVFERMTGEELTRTRADDWNPLGPPVEGPLDGLWFALQIVRHTAYHAGQISYVLQLPLQP